MHSSIETKLTLLGSSAATERDHSLMVEDPNVLKPPN